MTGEGKANKGPTHFLHPTTHFLHPETYFLHPQTQFLHRVTQRLHPEKIKNRGKTQKWY